MEIIKELLNKLEDQLPIICFLTFIITSLLLSLPDKITIIYGLNNLIYDHKQSLGITSLISFILTLAYILTFIKNFIQSKILFKKYQAQVIEHLQSLSNEEYQVLKGAVSKNQRTIIGVFTNPILQSLCKKGLLSQLEGIGGFKIDFCEI